MISFFRCVPFDCSLTLLFRGVLCAFEEVRRRSRSKRFFIGKLRILDLPLLCRVLDFSLVGLLQKSIR
ncbi:hypothetical protein E1A91_D08G123100v1 [Gossypium mustelinum]|uniref:Uncharacterized protein n=1 Tax=Gossypium mustelinum TaxID=34275 RepID=A0A5D2TX57_GOSMU|nr:hypothetical protein E1A91_D08G123100v1 [Gossypium mustelinum]